MKLSNGSQVARRAVWSDPSTLNKRSKLERKLWPVARPAVSLIRQQFYLSLLQ